MPADEQAKWLENIEILSDRENKTIGVETKDQNIRLIFDLKDKNNHVGVMCPHDRYFGDPDGSFITLEDGFFVEFIEQVAKLVDVSIANKHLDDFEETLSEYEHWGRSYIYQQELKQAREAVRWESLSVEQRWQEKIDCGDNTEISNYASMILINAIIDNRNEHIDMIGEAFDFSSFDETGHTNSILSAVIRSLMSDEQCNVIDRLINYNLNFNFNKLFIERILSLRSRSSHKNAAAVIRILKSPHVDLNEHLNGNIYKFVDSFDPDSDEDQDVEIIYSQNLDYLQMLTLGDHTNLEVVNYLLSEGLDPTKMYVIEFISVDYHIDLVETCAYFEWCLYNLKENGKRVKNVLNMIERHREIDRIDLLQKLQEHIDINIRHYYDDNEYIDQTKIWIEREIIRLSTRSSLSNENSNKIDSLGL